MRFVRAAVIAVGLVVLFVGGSVFYLSWGACLGGERGALTEFPHYAEPQIGPRPSTQLTCEVLYTTEASLKDWRKVAILAPLGALDLTLGIATGLSFTIPYLSAHLLVYPLV